jgi:F-type H+-transporting ATPase subunit delta
VKNLAIARRYAKALLLMGKEDGQVETYREEIAKIAALVSTDKGLERAITNPLYETAGRRKVLETLIEKLGLSQPMAAFLLLLFDKKRIGFLSYINIFYQKMADEIKGIARAKVVSAVELTQNAEEKIQTTLSKITGKTVVLDKEVDPALIGGVVTRVGDLVLDGSIRTQLFNMRETLKRGERA